MSRVEAESPVGDTSTSGSQRRRQQQQQEIVVAQLFGAIRENIRQQELLLQQQQQKEITAAARSRSDELRGWLMFVLTLTASITYSAALNPPGGVWQDDDDDKGYIAGRPVLLDKSPKQYRAFFYCNLASFMASLILIVVLSTPSFYDRIPRSSINYFVAIDILAWAAAFIAGSSTSQGFLASELALMLPVLVYIVATILLGRLRATSRIDQRV